MESVKSTFLFDEEWKERATIRVVGVGGGGGNAVNSMVDQGIQGVEFIAINTDSQALHANKANIKIQVGPSITRGLGAGARPSVGAEAVHENIREVEDAIGGSDMLFITAGMGGGTGTGGAPVVASVAKNMGILTVAVVTKPFLFEGKPRMDMALDGIQVLRENVDTMIVIPNEQLLKIADQKTSLIEAFSMVDDVLYSATRGISDLITVPGLINLDFADVRTTMEKGGTALMGIGQATGTDRAEEAAQDAIQSPLLEGLNIRGAKKVLVNITAGPSLGIHEAGRATKVIQEAAGEGTHVIFGTVIDNNMSDTLRVTVIATGFDEEAREEIVPNKKIRRTRPLDVPSSQEGIAPQYKGEENLRHLDQPAFERRAHPTALDGPATPNDIPTTEETASPLAKQRSAKILRLSKDDNKPPTVPPNRKADEDEEQDQPAFLRRRNMMD